MSSNQNLPAVDDHDPAAVLKDLQEPEQARLLDEIDKLRNLGVEGEVALPQLIVCGDTSAGKSSVLEAISGVPFPRKDLVCTRFATEISLRTSPASNVTAKIRPALFCTDEHKHALRQFDKSGCDPSEVPELIREATEIMGLAGNDDFSDDVLELRMSGPKMPRLTLVDLPGFIHSTISGQEGVDVQKVDWLVRRYMQSPRSIILAVIAASSPIGNQVVLRRSKEHDPQSQRTLGIITKLDTLQDAPDSQNEFIRLARNENGQYRYKLGWHILRNASTGEGKNKDFDRDAAEARLFSNLPYKGRIPSDDKGIVTLRKRLSKILFNQICTELPELIVELKLKQEEARKALSQLGDERDTKEKQRKFLHSIAHRFSDRTGKALEGIYSFGMTLSDYDTIDPKRLRAIVQAQSRAFADNVRQRGHTYEISEDSSLPKELSAEAVASIYNIPMALSTHVPQKIHRNVFVGTVVRGIIERNQGWELPGQFNPLLVGPVFELYSKAWETIALEFVYTVCSSIEDFLNATLSETSDPDVQVNIQRYIFEDAMTFKRQAVERKVHELLVPFKRRYPATMNPHFGARLEQLKTARAEAQGKDVSQAPMSPNFMAGSQLLDCMLAYYDIARETFIDNVIALAVESCLLGDLAKILTSDDVEDMTPEDIDRLVGESEETRKKRSLETEKSRLLSAALDICRRHEKRVPWTPRHTVTLNQATRAQELTRNVNRPRSGDTKSVFSSERGRMSGGSSIFGLAPAVNEASSIPPSHNTQPRITLFPSSPKPSTVSFSGVRMGTTPSSSNGASGFGASSSLAPGSGIPPSNADATLAPASSTSRAGFGGLGSSGSVPGASGLGSLSANSHATSGKPSTPNTGTAFGISTSTAPTAASNKPSGSAAGSSSQPAGGPQGWPLGAPRASSSSGDQGRG